MREGPCRDEPVPNWDRVERAPAVEESPGPVPEPIADVKMEEPSLCLDLGASWPSPSGANGSILQSGHAAEEDPDGLVYMEVRVPPQP